MDDFEACLTTTSTSSLSQAEFNQVVNYINRIKQRFALDPDTYEQFCEIFQAYHEEQRPVAEVHRRVSVLFNEHRDLLEDFHYFLPGGGTDTNDEDGVMGSVEADSSSELSGTTTGITCSPVPAGTPAPSSPSNRALNVKDALSYLEMVKVEIDTSEVVNRVCRLFDGHTALIEGFDVFLPQGYRIDCTVGQHDHNLITVTTPFGQITQITGGSPRHITSTRASPALLELPLLFGFDEPCPPLPPRPPSPFSYFDSSPATAPPVAALQTWQPMLSPYPAPSSTLALSHVDPSLDEKDHLMSTHNRVVNHLDRGQSEIFNNQPEQTEVNLSWSVISGGTPLFSVISLLVQHGCQDITDELDIPSCSKYPISTGGSGDIYRGRLREGLTVAIKCMRILADPAVGKQQKHLKDAAREINTWSKLEHRYISKLLGLALFRDQIAMLSPWAERRSLPAYLAGNSDLNRLLLVYTCFLWDKLVRRLTA
ncbi:hypothetical protein FRC09_001756 [Ceratobasidium sp. 395]|nr:hypothetical protein FRC09_001756 [Ceratobasidium sp. 395]